MMRSVVVSMCVSQNTAKPLDAFVDPQSFPRYRTPIPLNVVQDILFHRNWRGADELWWTCAQRG